MTTISTINNGESGLTVRNKLNSNFSNLNNDKLETNTLTTKGDIFVRNGSTVVRLSVGANGQVLQADSTASEGIKWANSASGGHTIQEEGVGLAQRTNLNFIGSQVTATDNVGNDATDVTISAASPGANTDITSILLNQTGLVVKGGDANALTFKPNEILTAPRTLNLIVNDADRTLTISGNASVVGTNTGDQTITLTGDVTGSGTGSFATTIANNAVTTVKIADKAVTTSKIQDVPINVLLGNFNDNPLGPVDSLQFGANRIAGAGASGGLTDLTSSEVRTIINVADGAIANIIEDTTPQLGGSLDCNGNNIDIDGGNSIRDENGNEQIEFTTTLSAVNHVNYTNSDTGNSVKINLTGDDVNIDGELNAKGTGIWTIDGRDPFRVLIEIAVDDPNGSGLTTGDGKAFTITPIAFNGFKIKSISGYLTGAQSSSGNVTVQIRNVTTATDILSTILTILANTTKDDGTAVIDTANNTISTDDIVAIDIDSAGTGAKGLIIKLEYARK